MTFYTAFCPVCGHINRNLLLEETDGWMECENCETVVNVVVQDGLIGIAPQLWESTGCTAFRFES